MDVLVEIRVLMAQNKVLQEQLTQEHNNNVRLRRERDAARTDYLACKSTLRVYAEHIDMLEKALAKLKEQQGGR